MSKKQINEKKFFSEVAAVILGKKSSVKVVVPSSKKGTLQEVLAATNMLYQALEKNDSDLNRIIPIIENKNTLAKKFEKEFGFPWVL